MRAAAVAFLFLAASCERAPLDEANLPDTPGTASSTDLPPATPPDGATPCTALPPEAAADANTKLPSVGSAAGWTIRDEAALVCSEPGPEGAVGCELAAGGTAVASKADKIHGFRNDTTAPVSILVSAEGMTCGPLAIAPSPP